MTKTDMGTPEGQIDSLWTELKKHKEMMIAKLTVAFNMLKQVAETDTSSVEDGTNMPNMPGLVAKRAMGCYERGTPLAIAPSYV